MHLLVCRKLLPVLTSVFYLFIGCGTDSVDKDSETLFSASELAQKHGVSYYEISDISSGRIRLFDASRKERGQLVFSTNSALMRVADLVLDQQHERLEFKRGASSKFPIYFTSLNRGIAAIVADQAVSPLAQRFDIAVRERQTQQTRPVSLTTLRDWATCDVDNNQCIVANLSSCLSENNYWYQQVFELPGSCNGGCGPDFYEDENAYGCACSYIVSVKNMVTNCITKTGCTTPGNLDHTVFTRYCVAPGTDTCVDDLYIFNKGCYACDGDNASSSAARCPAVNKKCLLGTCGCITSADCSGPMPNCNTTTHTCQ